MLVASANYTFLALIDISFRTLQPLFLSTPIALGGLGLDPPVIGIVLSFFGVLNGIFTVFFFSRLTDRFGVKAVYLTGISASVPCYALFPVINYLARNSIKRSGELGVDVWIAVGLQVVMSVVLAMCYGKHISKRIWTICGLYPVIQPRSSSSSPLLRPTKPLWALRTDSHKYRCLSSAQSDPP